MSNKKITEMVSDPRYIYMNQSLVVCLDAEGNLNQSCLVKEGYDKFGGSLEFLKDCAYRINEVFEGRGREYNEREG